METSKNNFLPRLVLYGYWYSLLLYVNERGRRLLEMMDGETAGDLARSPELPLRWTVCNQDSRGFHVAIRYYNNDSLITVRQYDTFQQGLLREKLKLD